MNKPIKKRMSIIRMTVIAIVNIIWLWNVKTFIFDDGLTIFEMLLVYLFYLAVVYWTSDLRYYISNSQNFSEYEKTFNKMTKGNTFIKFWIECYHYEKSGKNKNKKITHRANS